MHVALRCRPMFQLVKPKPTAKHGMLMCRQCSSGLQAIASVAASIQAGYYDIGLAGGVESMSTNPMAWDGGVNPKIAENQKAQDCLLPMGELLGLPDMISWPASPVPPTMLGELLACSCARERDALSLPVSAV